MKKQLIAAAVASALAVPAMAQNVTLGGLMDFAGSSTSGSQPNQEGTTISQTIGVSATSVIRIIATEDLGGGLRATAQYALDPRTLGNDAGAIGRDELFIGLSGTFGNIRLGSPNSIGLNTYQIAAPLGTGVGSGYAATVQDYSNIRYSRSARFDSPVMNGFQVSFLYAPGNDKVTVATPTTQNIANSREVTEMGLRYSAGPLTVGVANVSQAQQTNSATLNAAAINIAKTSSNIFAASYTLGATTLSFGKNEGDALFNRTATVTVARKSEGYRWGISHSIGAFTLLASYAVQKTDSIKEDVAGFRGDYNLSKRTAVYLGYENWDNKNATTAAADGLTISPFPAVNAGDRKITSLGIRHSF